MFSYGAVGVFLTPSLLDDQLESHMTSVERSGSWVELQTLDLENLGSNPVLQCWSLGQVFSLHCSNSLSCINKYLAIDSGGYVWTSMRINCSIWLDASQGSWDGVWLNRSARKVKCKSALSSPEDRILRYTRTYLYLPPVAGLVGAPGQHLSWVNSWEKASLGT